MTIIALQGKKVNSAKKQYNKIGIPVGRGMPTESSFGFRYQLEVVEIITDQPVLLHLAQFARHGAAVNREIIGELLPCKRNVEGGGLMDVHLLREVGEQLLACGTP